MPQDINKLHTEVSELLTKTMEVCEHKEEAVIYQALLCQFVSSLSLSSTDEDRKLFCSNVGKDLFELSNAIDAINTSVPECLDIIPENNEDYKKQEIQQMSTAITELLHDEQSRITPQFYLHPKFGPTTAYYSKK